MLKTPEIAALELKIERYKKLLNAVETAQRGILSADDSGERHSAVVEFTTMTLNINSRLYDPV